MRHRCAGAMILLLTIVVSAAWLTTAAAADNLLPNPGFESGWDVWAYEGSGYSTRLVPEAARTGSLGLWMMVRTNFYAVVYATIPIQGGAQYTVNSYVRTEDLTADINTLAVYFLDLSGGGATARYWYGRREGTTGWGKESITRTAPAGATHLRVFCWPFHANGHAYYDDFEIIGPPAPGPRIALSTTSIAASCEQGQDAPDTTFQVWNGGDDTLQYTVDDNGTSRLSVAPTSGSSTGSADKQTHTVSFHTAALAVGTHERTITVADNGSGAINGPLTIAVTITVTAPGTQPRIALSTTSIAASCEQGQDASGTTFEVWNGGDGTLQYTVDDNGTSRLSVTPTSGSSTGSADEQTHTVSFHTAALAVGTHERTITVADNGSGAINGPLTIAVTITVTEAGPRPVWVAYNDLSWATGQRTANITRYTTDAGSGTPPEGSSGSLVDFATGTDIGVNLSVAGGIWSESQAGFGADALPGTDAHGAFDGKVDCTGVVSFQANPLVLSLTGLDPRLDYELVLFGNRANAGYTDRITKITIGSAASFLNRSTAGADYAGAHDDSTVIVHGDNTTNGFVARFSEVVAGIDGALHVTVSDGGSAEPPRFYLNALMLRADRPTGLRERHKVGWAGTWRYRKGTREASVPAGAWRLRHFDAGAWPEGTAPFGYGDGPYGTELSDMRGNYSSVLLRRSFEVVDPVLISAATIQLSYDDGFIAWINGREVARVNVAGPSGSFVAHDATASGAVNDGTAWSNTLAGAALPELQAGANVLAVQVFNADLDNSSDLTFDAALSLVHGSALLDGDDADGDGLSDTWEDDRFGGTARDSTTDTDNDGHGDLAEFIAGTDPNAGTEYLDVAIARAPGSGIVASFDTIPAQGTGYTGMDRYYALEQTADAAQNPWSTVPGYDRILGLGQTVACTNAASLPGHALFRARVWLEQQ